MGNHKSLNHFLISFNHIDDEDDDITDVLDDDDDGI